MSTISTVRVTRAGWAVEMTSLETMLGGFATRGNNHFGLCRQSLASVNADSWGERYAGVMEFLQPGNHTRKVSNPVRLRTDSQYADPYTGNRNESLACASGNTVTQH